jgi:hypothetical protein
VLVCFCWLHRVRLARSHESQQKGQGSAATYDSSKQLWWYPIEQSSAGSGGGGSIPPNIRKWASHCSHSISLQITTPIGAKVSSVPSSPSSAPLIAACEPGGSTCTFKK